MDLAQIIGNNIRNLMDRRSVTIVELAKALNISRQTLQNYLKGANTIDSVKLVDIANYFSVPVSDLLTTPTQSSCFLFRTALNYQLATETISSKVVNCITSYYNLQKVLGSAVAYFPEQYNLSVDNNGITININYECTDYFSSKLKMTDELKSNLRNIAHEQRKKLGISGQNALSAIFALQQKGINIFFVDMGNPQTFGLSCVDEEKGCYIFVNCNENITLERMIFTVFHEYGHIILHRPIYKRRIHETPTGTLSFLDRMANTFAGYFLVPYEELNNYDSILSNLHSLNQLISIKHKFQISLQTLIITLENYNYVTKAFVSNYFNYIEKNNIKELEPKPLSDFPEICQTFKSIKNSKQLTALQNGYIEKMVDTEEIKNILWYDNSSANKLLKEFHTFSNTSDLFNISF